MLDTTGAETVDAATAASFLRRDIVDLPVVYTIMMQNEKWLAVVGWEGLYEVSDLGRVKSLRRGTILKPSYSNAGGYGVVIFSLNGRSFGRYIHRLVLE